MIQIDKIIFLMMIIIAIFIVSSRNYKRIVIALGSFSLLASFCYLLYHAPDVAIAEAIIGSALSTILYIVAVKKHRNFYIYFTSDDKKGDVKLRADMESILAKIRPYCQQNDLEMQTVFTWEKPESVAKKHMFDLILHSNNSKITVFGSETEKHVVAIRDLLASKFPNDELEFSQIAADNID